MRDENCIFCKIINGEIPSTRLYEDEDFVIMLDIGPASPGHALLIPKEHYANLYEMPEELLKKAILLAGKWGEKLQKVMGADGLNLVQNNGVAAGQTVYHFHMHLIPRYNGDGVGELWTPGSLSEEQRQEILRKLG
ncbi:MAG: HIT family protein [Lachnospiraceae bacterium]